MSRLDDIAQGLAEAVKVSVVDIPIFAVKLLRAIVLGICDVFPKTWLTSKRYQLSEILGLTLDSNPYTRL